MAVELADKDDLQQKLAENEAYGKHIRAYADTSNHACNITRTSWISYCNQMKPEEDPDELLLNTTPAFLKTFFDFLVRRSVKTRQASLPTTTLLWKLRTLDMVHKSLFKASLDPDMRKEAFNYIKYHMQDKAPDNPRAKPTPNAQDLRAMLCFLYTSDQTWYPNEYCRVQQGVLMLLHAFSGVRPGSAMNPNNKKRHRPISEAVVQEEQQQGNGSAQHDADELARLCYKDIELFLERDKSGSARLGMLVTFTRFKGENNRKQNKEFTYHTRRDPMTCLVTQFLVLCIHNGALRESARLTISAVLSLVIPPDRHKVVLAWHPEWLLKPVFTAPKADGTACELSRDQASRWLRGLGEGMGLKENLTWRCWRRLVSNAVDESGSEEQRNQITGHLDSQTYRAHYQNQTIVLDVPALVMGEETQDYLTRNLHSMCADADPQANASLTLEEQKEVDSMPELIQLRKSREAQSLHLKRKYSSIARADPQDKDTIALHRMDRQLIALRAKHKRYVRREKRDQFYIHRDMDLIDQQLDGRSVQLPMQNQQMLHAMPERRQLARLLELDLAKTNFSSEDSILVLELMLSLCKRTELRGSARPSTTKDSKNAQSAERPEARSVSLATKTAGKIPCFLCEHNPRLNETDCNKVYRKDSLTRHMENHFTKMRERGQYPCPQGECVKVCMYFDTAGCLLKHVALEHGILLLDSLPKAARRYR